MGMKRRVRLEPNQRIAHVRIDEESGEYYTGESGMNRFSKHIRFARLFPTKGAAGWWIPPGQKAVKVKVTIERM